MFPLHFPYRASPCAISFHLSSTVFSVPTWWGRRNSGTSNLYEYCDMTWTTAAVRQMSWAVVLSLVKWATREMERHRVVFILEFILRIIECVLSHAPRKGKRLDNGIWLPWFPVVISFSFPFFRWVCVGKITLSWQSKIEVLCYSSMGTILICKAQSISSTACLKNKPLINRNVCYPIKRRFNSHLPSASIIRSSPYSPHWQVNG